MGGLLGRRNEISRLRTVLDEAGQSRGGAVLLRGEAGIGKSALLDRLAESAEDFMIVRASGVEFETELPYSALHQLCVAAREHLGGIADPHRRALRIAFGMDSGVPDPFLVGMAALGILLGHDRPLLCLIDDAHWLDDASARAMGFVARRVGAERVAMVFATRERPSGLEHLRTIDVQPLDERDACALLARAIRGPLDERVRARILSEARGNPLALVELAATAGLTGMAGGFGLPGPAAAERSFHARLQGLSPQSRQLLTVAAAEPLGDPSLLWRATALLGLERTAAQDVPLIEVGNRVRFVHPLARSAAYRAATDAQRRRAHHALAQVSDPSTDPDRVAWHRAQASAGPDEEVAAALVASATRAQARGGVAAAAAFLERSAELTLDPRLRIERILAAAEAKLSAGDFDSASELLSTLPPDNPSVDILRGRISFARFRGEDLPTGHLLRAAAELADRDPAQARLVYVDAIEMSTQIGGLATVIGAVRTAPPAPPGPTRSADRLLDGMVALADRGIRAGVEILRPMVTDVGDPAWTRWPNLGYLLALEMWDPVTMRDIATRTTIAGRESGSFRLLQLGLAMLATVNAHNGSFATAEELIAEEEAIAEATGAAPLFYARVHLAALQGRRAEAEGLLSRIGPHMSISVQYASAVLNNGLSDYPAALRAARRTVASGNIGVVGHALPELVEAAVRCGRDTEARTALAALTERTSASGKPWGLGIEAYARALVHDDEELYQRAISLLDAWPGLVRRGRVHLVYGEWLRRQGRRRDARVELGRAHELLSSVGAEGFAARAATELQATGAQARRRSSDSGVGLTGQEIRIARMVADGATSKEVAAELFLSPRTVHAHLRSIFRKLAITSRRQLRDLPEIR